MEKKISKQNKKKQCLSQKCRQKMSSLHRHTVFGWARYAISILFLAIASINLLIQHKLTGNIYDRPQLTLLFIILSVMVYLSGTRKIISFILIILGIMTLIDPTNISDLTPSLFFIFAFHIVNSKKYSIFILLITTIGIAYRSSNMHMTIYQSFILLIGFLFMYTLYYFIIYRQLPQPIKNKLKQLSKDQNKLLELMCSGYPQESAGKELGHKRKQETSKMMKEIRELLEIDDSESNYKVIALYLKYGK